jgi:hypothetical protein
LWQSLENRCSPETGELACSSSLQVGFGGGGANCKPSLLWILEKALAQASSSRRLFLCRATAIACSAISFEQLELLSAFLLRRSSRRCDKFLNSSQNYYHIISSVIGSSNPLPMSASFNLFRINFHEAKHQAL